MLRKSFGGLAVFWTSFGPLFCPLVAVLLPNSCRNLAERWLNPAEPLPAVLALCGIKKVIFSAFLCIFVSWVNISPFCKRKL
jgi:hypothetical protein